MESIEEDGQSIVSSDQNQPKMTSWSNEPTVEQLKQNLTDAKMSHDSHVKDVKRWLDNLNITGSAKRKKEANRSSITPKLIRKQAEWRYASLSEPFLSTDDLYDTAPETYEDQKGAIQAGQILNHQFNSKLRKVAFIDEYVRATVDEGGCIVRTGWDYEEEEVEVEVPIIEVREIEDPIAWNQMVQQGLKPFEEVEVGTRIEKQMKTIRNQPTVEVCDYRYVIVDPTCLGVLEDAEFIIYGFKTSLSALKKDGKKYRNLNKIVVTEASVLAEPDGKEGDNDAFTFKDKPRKKFMAYEWWGFWDIHGTGKTVPIVATFVGNTVIRMEEVPFPDKKLPFTATQYLPVRKAIYGQPDGELLEDNQLIVGATTRGMIDIMGRSANGQMGISKAALDSVNKRKFDKGVDYEFNANIDARSAFYVHKFDAIPESAKWLLEQQNAEAESLTGVKAFHSGITGQALGSTATGIRSALDATSKRELGILRRLAEGVIEIGRKIMAMNSEFLSEEEVVRVTNEEFVTIRRDDIGGQYDIKLTISTAEADNEKAQELAFMLQTMGNNMDVGMSKLILGNIARLRKMPVLAKKIEEYEPQPDPLAQMEAELKIELLKAQIRNENAKAQENTVDVQYKAAKTATEQAKASAMGAKTDLDNQKFLDNDQGISHKQKMEAEDFKHRSQLDLKAADKLLGLDKEQIAPTSGGNV